MQLLWQKSLKTIFTKFCTLRTPVPTPFSDPGYIWDERVNSECHAKFQPLSVSQACKSWPNEYAYMSNFTCITLSQQNLAIFSSFTFHGGIASQWRYNAEHRCTTTNLSLFNKIKIIYIFERTNGKVFSTNSNFHSKDKQITPSNMQSSSRSILNSCYLNVISPKNSHAISQENTYKRYTKCCTSSNCSPCSLFVALWTVSSDFLWSKNHIH